MSLKERMAIAKERYENKTGKKFISSDLAKYCDVSRMTVSAWFSGKSTSIDGKNLGKVAEYLQVNPLWLVGNDDNININNGITINGNNTNHGTQIGSHHSNINNERKIDNNNHKSCVGNKIVYEIRFFAINEDETEYDGINGADGILSEHLPAVGEYICLLNEGDYKHYKVTHVIHLYQEKEGMVSYLPCHHSVDIFVKLISDPIYDSIT